MKALQPRPDLIGHFDGEAGEIIYRPETPFRLEMIHALNSDGSGWLLSHLLIRDEHQLMTDQHVELVHVLGQHIHCPPVSPSEEIRIGLVRNGALNRLTLMLSGGTPLAAPARRAAPGRAPWQAPRGEEEELALELAGALDESQGPITFCDACWRDCDALLGYAVPSPGPAPGRRPRPGSQGPIITFCDACGVPVPPTAKIQPRE